MRLIAGVSIDDDSAMACIADETGRVVARQISAVPTVEGGVWDAAAKRAAIEATLAATRTGLGAPARLDALVVGVSDYHEGVTPPPALDGLAERIAVVQYAEVAHIGALGGKPGIVVVAGAGSIALGTAPEVPGFVQAGGWGYPFGDDGGAYSIGREAVRSALIVADRGEPPSRLGDAALSFFSVSSLYELQHAYARREITRLQIADFARVALELATRIEDWPGAMDRDAWYIRNMATHALAELVMTVDARLPELPDRRVSCAGGVFADAGFLEKFASMLELRRASQADQRERERSGSEQQAARAFHWTMSSHAPELRPVPAAGDPLSGSLILARSLLKANIAASRFLANDLIELLHN